MLSPPRGLSKGMPTLVAESVAVTGTDTSRLFSIGSGFGNTDVKLQAVGTFVALKGNLEASLDGGTTYSVFVAFDFVASAIFVFDAVPGVLYRLNFTTVTTPVGVNVYAVKD